MACVLTMYDASTGRNCESSIMANTFPRHQGRQAAGHSWSALRVVKSCRKDCPTASVLPKPKQQLCIQNGTRAHYLNYLQEREGEAGKRSAGNRIGYQVIDRQVEDRQTGRNKANERWYPADRAAT